MSAIMGPQGGGSDSDFAPRPPKDTLLSLRTGKIRPFAGVKISSAINKQPRTGERVLLTTKGFSGDERDYIAHRNPDNAVHQYDPRHYDDWKTALPDRAPKFKIGAFGENIATSHLSETNVCVGDSFRLGPDAILQVTMSRQPCYKLNHRFEHKKMSSLVQRKGHTGWYYRVLQDGYVQEGDAMELIERVNPRWPLSRLQHYLYEDRNNMDASAEIAQLPGLSAEFIELFEKRLAQGVEDMNGRLQGDITVPWRSYKLVEKSRLTPRVQKFVFEPAEENAGNDCVDQFGRFPHVRVKFGPDAKFTRAYSVVSGSMCSFELGIAKDDNSRGGSFYLHNNLEVGDTLKVAKGHEGTHGPPTKDELLRKRHIFILGGIGVTAYLGEIRQLVEMDAQVEIHYAVRSKEEAAYLSQLPPEHTTLYAKDEGRRLRVPELVPELQDATNADVMVYCCGTTALLEETRKTTRMLGYPRSSTHFEEFGGAATGTGDPFEAEVKSTGQVLSVPGEKSLLQVLNEAGFDIDSSCLVGNCASCMVDLCKGEVSHQGVALDDEQKETTLLSCVSRGKGRIMIDC
ncbi:PK beta-barrel-protein domain-containing protein-like protein [Xylariomycetidae sp. FL0641]|nr:PK beta-barrel-protein domain-containing protein-like protein [Xylariomycetidae sp. FL0641]